MTVVGTDRARLRTFGTAADGRGFVVGAARVVDVVVDVVVGGRSRDPAAEADGCGAERWAWAATAITMMPLVARAKAIAVAA